MKKWIPVYALVVLLGFTSVTLARSAAEKAANPDQSLIAGKLTKEKLVNKTFVFSSRMTDFSDRILSLTLLENGKVQSRDTSVTGWKIGSDNSLNFYVADEMRASFRYNPKVKALVAKPFILRQQAYIKMWLAP